MDDINNNDEIFDELKEEDHGQLTQKEKQLILMYRNIFLIDEEGKQVFVDMLQRLGYWNPIEDEADKIRYNFAANLLHFMGVNTPNNLPRQVADWAEMPAELPGGNKW